jgi:hypothetical protein
MYYSPTLQNLHASEHIMDNGMKVSNIQGIMAQTTTNLAAVVDAATLSMEHAINTSAYSNSQKYEDIMEHIFNKTLAGFPSDMARLFFVRKSIDELTVIQNPLSEEDSCYLELLEAYMANLPQIKDA